MRKREAYNVENRPWDEREIERFNGRNEVFHKSEYTVTQKYIHACNSMDCETLIEYLYF